MIKDVSKRIICGVMTAATLASMCCGFAAYDKDELTQLIGEQKNMQAAAHQMAECARTLGCEDEHDIIKFGQDKWWEAQNKIDEYQKELDYLNSLITVDAEKKAAYPYAAQVWETLRNAGYNKYVTAGILGNMMAECGGQTLALQPFIYTRGYYGLCMWYVRYTPQVAGQDVAGQLQVLMDTMKKNINYFGGSYDYFISLQDAGAAARYFEVYYGRGQWSNKRITNANKALAYFQV